MVCGKHCCSLCHTLDRLRGVKLNAPDIRGLLGVFLADGHLTRSRSARASIKNYTGGAKGHIKATIHGGMNERAFLEEKAEEIRRIIPTEAKISTHQLQPSHTGHRTTVLRFRFSSPLLEPVYNLFYVEGEREITRPLLDVLGLQAAAWLWAEGFRDGPQGATLGRVGSLLDEARLISGWLEVLTGASSTIGDSRPARKKPYLIFNQSEAERVKQALLPYAPASRRSVFLPLGS